MPGRCEKGEAWGATNGMVNTGDVVVSMGGVVAQVPWPGVLKAERAAGDGQGWPEGPAGVEGGAVLGGGAVGWVSIDARDPGSGCMGCLGAVMGLMALTAPIVVMVVTAMGWGARVWAKGKERLRWEGEGEGEVRGGG